MTAPKTPQAKRAGANAVDDGTNIDQVALRQKLQWQYGMVPARALWTPGLTGRDRDVLLAIATHWDPRDPTGSAYPSFTRIAAIIGISRSQVARSVTKLTTLGDPPCLRKRLRRNSTSHYEIVRDAAQVVTPVLTADPQVVTPESTPGDNGVNTCLQGCQPSVDTGVNQTDSLNTPWNQTSEQSAPARAVFGFEGKVLQVDATTFDDWVKTYWAIPDLKAELKAIDLQFQKRGIKPQDAVATAASWLNRAHQRTAAEQKRADQPPDYGTGSTKVSHDQWVARLLAYKKDFTWGDDWGPKPDRFSGCKAPYKMLKDHGFNPD